jgi:hypothetical protein
MNPPVLGLEVLVGLWGLEGLEELDEPSGNMLGTFSALICR